MRRVAHDTPVTFSSDEIHKIRQVLEKHQTPRCPHCGSDLEICGPLASGATQGPVLHILCATCDRCTFVSEAPATPRPGGPV